MKNYVYRALLLIVVTLFSSSILFAQRGAPKFPEFHYLTLSFSGGYSNFSTKLDNATVKGGGGGFFGIGYEYCYRSFWLSLGVEGQYMSSLMMPGLDTLHVDMIDTEGEPFIMNYHFDRWRDMSQAVYVNIPFMLGINSGGFYIGIGAKAGMNMLATGKGKLEYNTTGTYPQFIEDFHDMNNHWFGDFVSEPVDKKPTKLVFKPNVSIIGEVGYEVFATEGIKSLPMRMKVAAYGEYGIMNINGSAKDEVKAYDFGDPNPAILVTPGYLSTSNLVGKSVNPFYVGVKLTLMFELPVPQKCNCLQDSRGASWRNNAPKVTKKQAKRAKKARQDSSKEK